MDGSLRDKFKTGWWSLQDLRGRGIVFFWRVVGLWFSTILEHCVHESGGCWSSAKTSGFQRFLSTASMRAVAVGALLKPLVFSDGKTLQNEAKCSNTYRKPYKMRGRAMQVEVAMHAGRRRSTQVDALSEMVRQNDEQPTETIQNEGANHAGRGGDACRSTR